MIRVADLFCGASKKRSFWRLSIERLSHVRGSRSESSSDYRVAQPFASQSKYLLPPFLALALPLCAFAHAGNGSIRPGCFDGQIGSDQHQKLSDLVKCSHSPDELLLVAFAGFAQRGDFTESESLVYRVDGVLVSVDDRHFNTNALRLHVDAAFAIKESSEPGQESVLRPVREVVDALSLTLWFAHSPILLPQPHELSAAMSFPKSYQFSGNKGQTIKQVGNAVDVSIARALGLAILEARDGKTQKSAREAVA